MNRKPWRSLEELAGAPEFGPWLQREFPALAAEWPPELSRRNFLRFMGASLALAGAAGCTRQPLEKIVPYVQQPEDLTPGQPRYFASALNLGGFARGVLVESHEGRPTKIEGNPEHPLSLGGSDVFMQAELLSLYDPDRSQHVVAGGEVHDWDALLGAISREREKWRANGGAGLRVLTGAVASPTLHAQLEALLQQFPAARWHVHDPLATTLPPVLYDLSRADVILSLDCDFLGPGPAQLRYTRDFCRRRRAGEGEAPFNRLHVMEPSPTLTGAMADHRIAAGPRELEEAARRLFDQLSSGKPLSGIEEELRAAAGRGLILAGGSLSPDLQQAARARNKPLEIAAAEPPRGRPVEELLVDLAAGKVEALIVLGGNPAYDLPGFAALLPHAEFSIRLGQHEDETSAACGWHLPEAHPLEAWSDARALDGTVTIQQPLIEPLYGGKSAHELIAALAGQGGVAGYDLVRNYWQVQHGGEAFERFWRTALHSGVIAPPAVPPGNAIEAAETPPVRPAATSAPENALELLIRPDPHLLDGRYANNAWLQELPQHFTKLTWGNAALISPALAQRLGLANEDLVELTFHGLTARAPVWVLPGQAGHCVTVHLGHGRTRAGRVGTEIGFNAYALRHRDFPWGGPGLAVRKCGGRSALASTQLHHSMEGRDLARSGTLQEFTAHPAAPARGEEPEPAAAESLYPAMKQEGHAWGMVIDLSTCTGCNACTIACQAENNIPVVGAEQVRKGREMHWIRVDTYFEGSPESPAFVFQPVPCMHCENAPCELVCPVAATVHSSEGLNQMVYNRCIGTRYCSNNCPYKVRRFNFLEYQRSPLESAPVLALGRNPEVTVRSRGVMEKCTYCVQRISRARIAAEKDNRSIADGAVTPACAQACPAEAIVFGDLRDPESHVARAKASPRNYALLGELNTRPRTTYLARLRNPHPASTAL